MKERLDVAVARAGLAPSREKAKALIIAGEVEVDGSRVSAPSAQVREDAVITVRSQLPFVSRGGLKLEKAVDTFSLDLADRVCADLGASTGGFTDCMLQHGARHVYSVDVGFGQLAWRLRQDPRVTVLERTNARYLESLNEPVDFISTDVSFISLTHILPVIRRIGNADVEGVLLVKPQFEAGRENVGKKGVVHDAAVHLDVLKKIAGAARGQGLVMTDLTYSPITGPNGNIEFPVLLRTDGREVDEEKMRHTVTRAHQELDS